MRTLTAPAPEHAKAARGLGLPGRALHAVAWVVMVAVAVALVAAVLVPRATGATPYTIVTGSMEPTLPPGTLVVVRPAEPADIGIGSVITYQLESGKRAVVTHRVVAQGLDARGAPVFRTQGDANDAPDRAWVMPVQVKGEVWYSVPHLGRVNTLVTDRRRDAALLVVVTGLFGYAGLMFVGAARDRRRGRAA